MDDIDIFLARAVPWPTETQPGYVSIHYPFRSPDMPPEAPAKMPGQAFTVREDAKRFVLSRRTHVDLYVCMSLQAEHGGQLRNGLRAKRSKRLALLLNGIWLDVDIKDGFFHSTQHAAEEAEKWRVRNGLPDFTRLVLTGSGGFHLHFGFTQPVSRETWQPLADALANAAQDFKPLPGPDGRERQLDLGVTIDPARVLRIPDTFNFKHTPPLRASLAHEGESYDAGVIERALERFKGQRRSLTFKSTGRLQTSSVFNGMAEPTPLDAGIAAPIPTLENVMNACPWVKRVAETGGKGCSEPEWKASLNVAYFCRDSHEVAHRLSDGYGPDAAAETDAKFAQVVEAHMANKDLGWPSCAHIYTQAGVECRSCPHLVEEKSPFHFVVFQQPPRADAPPTPAGPSTRVGISLPRGYFFDGDFLYRRKDKTSEKVTAYPISNVRSYAKREDGAGDDAVAFDTIVHGRFPKTIVISGDNLKSAATVQNCLHAQGMIMSEQSSKHLRHFMTSFVEQLHERKAQSADSEPYGWSMSDGKRAGVVCFDRRFNCSGVQHIAAMDLEVSRLYQAAGSLDVWKVNAKLLTQQQRPDIDIIMAASFGGILVPLTGIDGCVLAAYSPESGLGKSHGMRVGQAVWAQPVRSMASVSDTANFVIKKLGILRHIPFFFDEVKLQTDMETVVNMVFSMTQGKTKGRLGADLQTREVFEFNTLMAVASNDSLTDYINEHIKTSTAGLNRIYEVPVQPNTKGIGLVSRTDAQKAYGDLKDNYGHAGVVYCEYLGKNIELVENMVLATSKALEEMLQSTNDERFWLATMTVCYVGAVIANRLGLTEINEQALLEYMIQNFQRLRAMAAGSIVDITKAQSCERYVQDYINAHQRQFLITDTVPKGRGRVAVGSVKMFGNRTEWNDGVRVRYAYEDCLVRLSISDFRDWLRKVRGVGPSQIVEALKRTMGATIEKTTLGAGTSIPTSREEVLQIDVTNRPGFVNLNIIDQPEEDA